MIAQDTGGPSSARRGRHLLWRRRSSRLSPGGSSTTGVRHAVPEERRLRSAPRNPRCRPRGNIPQDSRVGQKPDLVGEAAGASRRRQSPKSRSPKSKTAARVQEGARRQCREPKRPAAKPSRQNAGRGKAAEQTAPSRPSQTGNLLPPRKAGAQAEAARPRSLRGSRPSPPM